MIKTSFISLLTLLAVSSLSTAHASGYVATNTGKEQAAGTVMAPAIMAANNGQATQPMQKHTRGNPKPKHSTNAQSKVGHTKIVKHSKNMKSQ